MSSCLPTVHWTSTTRILGHRRFEWIPSYADTPGESKDFKDGFIIGKGKDTVYGVAS